jgi:DNA polymerase-3 subunit delta'
LRFADIPGLQDTKDALTHAVRNGNIAHAQLFLGREGTGNLSLALAYAQYVNCENPGEQDACGQCPSCHKFEKHIHPDVHFIFPTATSKTVTKDPVSQLFLKEWRTFLGSHHFPQLPDWAAFAGMENKQCSISKEESRNIIRALSLKAFEATYKVMFIWLPEHMHPAAANAILKILEEPPEKTLFLLVSHDINALLPTIISRTQIINVRNFTDEEISGYLQGQLAVPREKASKVAYLSEGNMHEALKLQADVQDVSADFFKEWMRSCFKSDYKTMMEHAELFNRMSKEDQKGLLGYGLGLMREVMLVLFAAPEMVRLKESELMFVQNFAKVFDSLALEKISAQFDKSVYHLERNANPKMLFMNLSLSLAEIFRRKS